MVRVPFRVTRRLPPSAGDSARYVAPWLIGLMVYIASLAGIGLILVDETLRSSENALASRLTVQAPAETSEARVETILAVLRQIPGVRSVHLLTPAETRRLLEPWIGSMPRPDELPMPRLIDVGLAPAATIDMAKLGSQLASVVPDMRVDDYRPAIGVLRDGARPLQALLGAAIAGALLLVAASAAYTTSAAFAARRSDAELLHLLGAEDRQIARRYAARALIYGLLGGGIAAIAIVATVAALEGIGRLISLTAPAKGIDPGDWRLWTVLVIMTIAAGIVAAASARATALRRLSLLP